MAYWQPLRGIMDPIAVNQFGGVYNSGESGFAAPEGLAQDIRNISASEFPALSTRPGFSIIGDALGGRVTGLSQWQGQELHAIANGVWSKLVGSTWTPISGGTGLDTGDCSFANFKGNLSAINLIMANGVNAKRYDGSIVQNLANAPAGINYIEQHDGRLYGAVGNRLVACASNKPEDWSSTGSAGAWFYEHETNDGETVIGLKAGAQHLTVFKRSSMYELFGTGPNNFKLIEVAPDIGANSNKAIVTVSGMMYFISNRIYRYAGGTRPDSRFSTPVQKYVDGINQAALSKCVAGMNGKNPYFAIPYGTATECNMILEFDTTYNAWYVWDNVNATQMAYFKSSWYVGDTGGKVLQMGASAADNGSPISWKWVSPPITGGNIAQRIRWHKTWVVFSMPAGSALNMYLSKSEKGDGDWELIKSFTSQTAIQSGKIVMPISNYANAMFIRIKFEGTGPITIYEFDRQLRKMPLK